MKTLAAGLRHVLTAGLLAAAVSALAAEGRWGPFGQFWGGNPALPASPLWLLASSFLVAGAGVAVIVVTY